MGTRECGESGNMGTRERGESGNMGTRGRGDTGTWGQGNVDHGKTNLPHER